MARSYSIKEFFRQMPNALLARFFHEQGLFADLDFAGMKETVPEPLFCVWVALPEKSRKALDALLQEIFLLSCEKGFLAIIDEAQWQIHNEPERYVSFVNEMSALPDHYHRAMHTYLNYPECWKGATRFYHADTLSYWRKRKNLGHFSAATDTVSLNHLADLIRDYFHQTEGRGKNCVVESFRRHDLDYFFAYPEDYSQHTVEWVDGEFGRRPHNPAFEIVYVYSRKEGSLDLNFRGAHKHSSYLTLLIEEKLKLSLAGHIIALTDVLSFVDSAFKIDRRRLNDLVDHPIAGAGDKETAQLRRERLQKRVNQLKDQNVKSFLKTTAEEEGISVTRLKQILAD